MYIEYGKNEKEVKRYKSFSARKVKALYKKYGEAATNDFLDRLDRYGEAHLRPLDPSKEDNGILFRKVSDEDSGGTGTTDGAPGNSDSSSGTGNGNSPSVAT